MSNTWVIYLQVEDNPAKARLILNVIVPGIRDCSKMGTPPLKCSGTSEAEIRNSNLEIRNNIETQMTECLKHLDFENLNLFRILDLEIRVSTKCVSILVAGPAA